MVSLKLATADTPTPAQAAISLAGAPQEPQETTYPPPVYAAPLEYAREGLPTAPRRSIWRMGLAAILLGLRVFGWLIAATLVVIAYTLYFTGASVRAILAGAAGAILFLRRLSPYRFYAWMRYGGPVPDAQVA